MTQNSQCLGNPFPCKSKPIFSRGFPNCCPIQKQQAHRPCETPPQWANQEGLHKKSTAWFVLFFSSWGKYNFFLPAWFVLFSFREESATFAQRNERRDGSTNLLRCHCPFGSSLKPFISGAPAEPNQHPYIFCGCNFKPKAFHIPSTILGTSSLCWACGAGCYFRTRSQHINTAVQTVTPTAVAGEMSIQNS